MKDDKKSGFEVVRLPVERLKGGGGDEGLATAPTKNVLDKRKQHPPDENRGLGRGSEASDDQTLTVDDRIDESSLYRVIGDDGLPYYVWEYSSNAAVIPASVAVAGGRDLHDYLIPLNIDPFSPASRKAIRLKLEGASRNGEMIVVTRAGYEQQPKPRYYVFADSTVVTPVPNLRVFFKGTPDHRFASMGDFGVYEREISKVISDQSVPMLLLFYSLTPLLQAFARDVGFVVQNTVLEVSGKTTAYKSSLTNFLAGSVWGGSSTDLGFAYNWNATATKIEDRFDEYNNTLVVLDEVTAASGDVRERGRIVTNVAHRLSGGMTRGRHGQISRPFNVMVLSSSNQSLSSILSETGAVVDALQVRFIQLIIPDRPTGVFDTVPPGFQNIDLAVGSIFATVRSHRGMLAKRFAANILAWRHRDEAGFSAALMASINSFMTKVGLRRPGFDRAEERAAKPFALAYAAAELAFMTKTLERQNWGKFRKTLRRSWRKYGRKAPKLSGIVRLENFLTDASIRILDLRSKNKPELSDEEFDRIDAFVNADKRGKLYLAMSPKKMKQYLGLRTSDLKIMAKAGQLKDGKHLQTRLRLHRKSGVEQRISYYAFYIEALPPQAGLVD